MSAHELVRLEYHEVTATEGFAGWLHDNDVALAFTNGARLFMVGATRDGALHVSECQYNLATALHVASDDTIYLATRYQIWRLQNALPAGDSTPDGCDRLYIPQSAWTTGLVGVHDLTTDAAGEIVFVNGLFSCLATVSETLNFRPLWVPPWISALAPEDRCRLTGVVTVDGEPRYATSASRADSAGGWREDAEGGVVCDITTGDVIADGLSLPYSPVLVADELWLCNANRNEVGVVDVTRGDYTAVARLPGLTRGLARVGTWAAVGTSRSAWGSGGDDSEVCGVHIVDCASGRVEHALEVAGVAVEIGDVAILSGARAPKPIAFVGDDVENFVTIPLRSR